MRVEIETCYGTSHWAISEAFAFAEVSAIRFRRLRPRKRGSCCETLPPFIQRRPPFRPGTGRLVVEFRSKQLCKCVNEKETVVRDRLQVHWLALVLLHSKQSRICASSLTGGLACMCLCGLHSRYYHDNLVMSHTFAPSSHLHTNLNTTATLISCGLTAAT